MRSDRDNASIALDTLVEAAVEAGEGVFLLLTDTQREIFMVCLQDAFMLLRKNAQYGDSALNPVRVFSQADPAEQILVRLDDKMSRVAQSGLHGGDDGEDTAADIRGYLVLEEIAHRRRQKS